MNTSCVVKCPNCVVEKTVRRAGRAWRISLGRCEGKPGSERSFLAGETESVFVITDWGTRISFITDLEMQLSLTFWKDFNLIYPQEKERC